MSFSPDQLNQVKALNPVDALAGQWVTLRRKSGRRGSYVGPCPMCSDNPRSKTASRFECDADKWVCAVCADGGDVIKLVQKHDGVSFVEACERLGGQNAPALTPALAERRGVQDFHAAMAATKTQALVCDRAAGGTISCVPPADYPADLRTSWARGWQKAEKQHAASEHYREAERESLYIAWRSASDLAGSAAEQYLAARGLKFPDNAALRCHPRWPMYAVGRNGSLVHEGPAMFAAIIAASGRFSGLHITWLDPAGPTGKAHVFNPGTDDVLPSKKVRGTKLGGFINLGGVSSQPGPRMFAGEGIETVLAVYTALRKTGRLREGDVFRAGVDLGNLAGRATETVTHPTLKSGGGRAQRVPGPVPDLESPAMPVPDAISELVLLGDGDSEPVLTRNALERAKARHTRPDRTIKIIFAPAGRDFNDLL